DTPERWYESGMDCAVALHQAAEVQGKQWHKPGNQVSFIDVATYSLAKAWKDPTAKKWVLQLLEYVGTHWNRWGCFPRLPMPQGVSQEAVAAQIINTQVEQVRRHMQRGGAEYSQLSLFDQLHLA
ncbi:MAG TPA: hypothetical protein VMR98_03215, partial [Candidatus Polarisedimenticolaceae bacterium]|nr:hypothetical protein [Candidatus Polarisedimenticolaceae bacterium]